MFTKQSRNILDTFFLYVYIKNMQVYSASRTFDSVKFSVFLYFLIDY